MFSHCGMLVAALAVGLVNGVGTRPAPITRIQNYAALQRTLEVEFSGMFAPRWVSPVGAGSDPPWSDR